MDPFEGPPGHRSGFIALAGRPNVGKSTLINRLLGQPVAAVSPRPQTTRKSQLGILTLPEAQLIFVDTPGIHQPQHKLGEHLNHEAQEGMVNADVIVMLVDLDSPPNQEDQQVVQHLQAVQDRKPLLLALNKVDIVPEERLSARTAAYRSLIPDIPTFGISAVTGEGVDRLLETLIASVPEGPRLYPEDSITLTYERDIAADLIRAAALDHLRDEVPHAIAIRIDTFTERGESGAYIEATVFVERDSQKGIVIGKGGSMLKLIGSQARKSIEAVLDRKIFLELRVKVLPNWRNDPNALLRFGFVNPAEPDSPQPKGSN